MTAVSRAVPIVVERREEAEVALAREIVELVRRKHRVVLGLATGSTMTGLYRELARRRVDEAVDFGGVVTFNLDEYLDLPRSHAATLAQWTQERVLAPLGIAAENAHFLSSDLRGAGVAEDCRAYERAIEDAGGIDLQILGLGRDGHIAFNEPGSSRESRTREVDLHEWTREDAAVAFGGLDAVPKRAVTMGVATILAAKRIRVLAFGARKAAVARRMFEDPIGPGLPATFLREHEDLVVWLDREATGPA